VDAFSSVCLDGIVGIRSVGACDVISRVPRVLVGRERLAEKQDERADDQHGEHQNLELIDDCDDGRLAGEHVVNRYLRVLFVQAAWVVLVKQKSWERYGLKPWIEAAKRRLHHNVLAIALANRLARIAWAVLNKERDFECVKTSEMASRSA
jgi:hypothetical protein